MSDLPKPLLISDLCALSESATESSDATIFAAPPRLLISDLCQLVETYLEPQQIKEVYRAYVFGAEAHDGQKRISGEPYIDHPIAVAYLLGKMHMDVQTIVAALLHDVIEDTTIPKDILINEFGEEVAELVDGVSKLSRMPLETRAQAQAASFRKMVLAMNRDIRVIIVKLADRLHNMRTIKAMKPESQRRIARETLEIYAPIAQRLGMNTISVELQELSFAVLYPLRCKVLGRWLLKIYDKHAPHLSLIQSALKECFKEHALEATIQEHKTRKYSLYRRIREKKSAASTDKHKSCLQLTKTHTLQIVVEDVDSCYRALGLVHSLYKPRCERFRDYISIPKINGYQSLHTVLVSPYGLQIEVHIRTKAMHELAEYGITAYNLYQFDSTSPHTVAAPNHNAPKQAKEWLSGLLEMPGSSGDSLEFLEQVKLDLSPDEVYIFTPKGKILQLPKGATAIDFAFAVHSDVGSRCIAAKVDNEYVPLSTQLVSGQTVEALTAAWATPNPSWLNFAATARARSHILSFLKNLTHDKAIVLGKRLLDKELSAYSLSVDKLSDAQQATLFTTFKVSNLNALLVEIGLGNRIALVVARQLDPTTCPETTPIFDPADGNKKTKPLIIKGTEGILVNFSDCCRPIPDDPILGFVNAGHGIVIHTAHCKHIANYHQRPERLLPVEWESGIEGEFLVDISVDVRNRSGVLAAVAAAITNMDSNIERVSNKNRDGLFGTLKFCITVRNRTHLAAIIRHLRRLDAVTRIQRSKS